MCSNNSFYADYTRSGEATVKRAQNVAQFLPSGDHFAINSKYRLARTLEVTVTNKDGEYIATFPAAELSRSGDSEAEAIQWLLRSMVDLYELFKNEPSLGPLPQRQFDVLRKFIG